jgi:hypothetical protein
LKYLWTSAALRASAMARSRARARAATAAAVSVFVGITASWEYVRQFYPINSI